MDCTNCKGSGKVETPIRKNSHSSIYDGRGLLPINHMNTITTKEIPCPSCKGTGIHRPNIPAFLEEIKALQERHGLKLRENGYESDLEITDDKGDVLATMVDLGYGTFTPEIDHSYGPQPYREPRKEGPLKGPLIGMGYLSEILKANYAAEVRERLNEPSPLMDVFSRNSTMKLNNGSTIQFKHYNDPIKGSDEE